MYARYKLQPVPLVPAWHYARYIHRVPPYPVDFEAKPKELTGRSRSVSKDFTEQMKLIYKSHYNTHILDVLARKIQNSALTSIEF